MKPDENSLSDQLATTVGNTGSLGISAEIAEFAIDQALDSGILKDIPFVGWIAKGLSIHQNISDRILYSKILRFITRLEAIPLRDKSEFQKRIREDHEYRRDVGEHLLNLIDRLDDFKKTDALASCFDHFLTGDIDHEHFVELSSAIDRLTSRDLAVLALPRSTRISFSSVGRAVASGVMDYGITESRVPGESPSIGWAMTDIGQDLRDILLGEYRGRDERRAQSTEEMNRQLNRQLNEFLNKTEP